MVSVQTTTGVRRRSKSAIGLIRLPELIGEAEGRGTPVIIHWSASTPMPAHTQRLYAELGCLVRFVP